MTEKSPFIVEDQYAHQIEPDRAVTGVDVLGEAGCRQSFKRVAIGNFLGEALAVVLTELAADEDQVVLFVGDEVNDVAVVCPVLFEDFETPALEIDLDSFHLFGVDGFHGRPS